jgi:hypothetical protein
VLGLGQPGKKPLGGGIAALGSVVGFNYTRTEENEMKIQSEILTTTNSGTTGRTTEPMRTRESLANGYTREVRTYVSGAVVERVFYPSGELKSARIVTS